VVVAGVDLGTVLTAGAFRGLLKAIADAAGLTPGRMTARKVMARSSAYHLIDPTAKGLPRFGYQVRALLRLAKVSDGDTTAVMALWERLKHTTGHPRPGDRGLGRRDG
jgi:hypothetical protein